MVRRTSFDRFDDRYARRVMGIRSSAMRDLMAITQRPEVISLAGGLPEMSLLADSVLSDLLGGVSRNERLAALQYGPTEGMRATIEAIVTVMARQATEIDPARVLVTTGGQQALDLVARAFVDPGDIVLAEGPTYPGVVPVFSSYQAEVRQLPLDGDGLDPAVVARELDNLAREGRRAKYLYTIPTFQNPAGVTMPLARRKALVQLAAERDLLILEDDPYSLLRYDGEPVPSLRSLDTAGNVMYTSTFSKIFAPGMRVGWIEAPPEVLAKINLVKQAADLCTSSLAQTAAAQFIATYDVDAHLAASIATYRSRRNAMLRALATYFPEGSTWTTPQGGLFVWARVPPYIDTTDLLARALQHDVAFVPGAAAHLDGTGTDGMRLNFSAMDEAAITEGIKRIALAIEETIELARAVGLDDDVQVVQ